MKSLTHSVAAMTLLVAANSAAGPGSSNVNISLTGEVIATASCSFSNGDPIKVEFGDV